MNRTIAGALDRAMEAVVVPSFSSIGPHTRARIFDWTPEAELPRLDGKVALVTGATSGLGEAAASALASLGASVRLLARSADKLAASERRIKDASGNDDVRGALADLASLEQVRRFADDFSSSHDRLDVLIHNAGALPKTHERTPDGVELTAQTHVVAPYLLTTRLLPLLERAHGRVIWVTSGGMYSERLSVDGLDPDPADFKGVTAYARAKRAQVALVAHWAPTLSGVTMHAMHPGWADTPGVQESLPRFAKLLAPILRTPAEGADTMVWLATADEPTRTNGRLWLDRRPRSAHKLPWTRRKDEAAEAQRLLDWCARVSASAT